MPNFSILQLTSSWVVALILFFLLLFSYVLGNQLIRRNLRLRPDLKEINLSTINGMLLGLLGLLLAFSFSMSNSRFDTRRELAVQEANAIGTVVLRTKALSDSMHKVMMPMLSQYLEQRIAAYEAGMDLPRVFRHLNAADSIGSEIWNQLARYSRLEPVATETSKMIPAVNEMLDITVMRLAAGEATIPDSIMYFLFALCLGSAFLLGYDHRGKIDWIILVGFALVLSATVLVIIDLDRPRSGFIRMDRPNQKIIELRKMFEE
jgi:hypothetical protein